MIAMTIIVLLASVAAPSYNMVKKQATWSKTPGQMSKVIEAFHTYAADHNNYYPPAYFPKGGSSSQEVLDDTLDGECGWLNSTIYAQVYPDASSSTSESQPGGAGGDATDNTSKSYKQSDTGDHLQNTVFEVKASVLANPADTNLYNHSFLLNRSLVTERSYEQDEFAPRKSTIFTDLSSTMLLTEGLAGDKYNSISFGDTGGEVLEQGFKRYDKHFIHVGYMDGRVVRMKEKEFPKTPDADMGEGGRSDAAFIFWMGVGKKEYETLMRTGPGRINY